MFKIPSSKLSTVFFMSTLLFVTLKAITFCFLTVPLCIILCWSMGAITYFSQDINVVKIYCYYFLSFLLTKLFFSFNTNCLVGFCLWFCRLS